MESKLKKACFTSESFLSLGKIKRIRVMKKINFTMLLATVACFMISVGIITGTVQNYIHFANVENEIGTCAMSMFGTILFTLGIKK